MFSYFFFIGNTMKYSSWTEKWMCSWRGSWVLSKLLNAWLSHRLFFLLVIDVVACQSHLIVELLGAGCLGSVAKTARYWLVCMCASALRWMKCQMCWGVWVGRCDLVLSACLVKEYTNAANGDPPAREEKGIRLTATIQTVTKDSFIQQWRLLGLKRNFFKGKE